MADWKLTQWCYRATRLIRYKPDREAVKLELRQHMEDRCESFQLRGMTREAAVERTVEVMGDPVELAPQLAAIHRPFWGYLFSITKWLSIAATIAMLCFTVMTGIYHFMWASGLLTQLDDSIYFTRNQFYDSKRTLYITPNSTAEADGYTFTVTEAAKWQHEDGHTSFLFRIEVSNLRPWAESLQAVEWFWAEDSLGNYYYSSKEAVSGDRCIRGNRERTGVYTEVYEYWLEGTEPQEYAQMQWLDLHYDRGGRNIVLRIDLTGGGEA